MLKIRQAFRRDLNFSILICVTLAILLLMLVFLGDKMYNERNFTSMMFQVSEFGILCIGMGLVMLLGGIDLSIVANANLGGICAAFVMTNEGLVAAMGDGVVFLGILVGIVAAVAAGTLNGILISKFSVNPIVATLGTMIFYNGIGMASTGGKGITNLPDSFASLGTAQLGPIPVIFIIFLAVTALIVFIMGRTGFGRKVYMIGENHTAARFSSINNEKNIIITYAMAGLMAGIAGIMIIARVNSAKVGYGDTYLLQAILVCVLGGISPSGGRGKVLGILLALFSVQILQSAFTLWQFTPYSKNMIWGLMLLGILFLNMLLSSIDTKRQKRLLKQQLSSK